MSEGFGIGVDPAYGSSFSTSSAMMSLHRPMHSSQMYTVGPAMSFFTSFWFLPQKEQLRLPWLSSLRLSKFLRSRRARLLTLARVLLLLDEDLVDDAVLLRLARA